MSAAENPGAATGGHGFFTGISKEIDLQDFEQGNDVSRLLVKNLTDYGIFMADTSGTIQSWNPGIERILGYTETEFVGRHLSIMFTAGDIAQCIPQKELEQAVAMQRVEHLRWQVKKDGSRFLSEGVTAPVKNDAGELIGVMQIFRDIGGHRKEQGELLHAQNETERQKRLYEAITGSTLDLMYVFDLNYRFIYANEALLKMWGLTWESSIGKSLLEIGYEPWHAEMHEREIDEVVASKKPIRGEVSFPHATLGRRMYDYLLVPVINGHGEVEAVAGTTRDITELKRAQEALQQSGEKLEALVEERTRELHRSNRDLQQFAHVASHDLKEPIRKISTFARRLEDEFAETWPSTARTYLEKIKLASSRMFSMIEGVLLYSSLNAMEQQSEKVNMMTLLQNIQTDLEVPVQQKNAVINVGPLPDVAGAPVLLYQLFYNLINNSLKFARTELDPVITVSAVDDPSFADGNGVGYVRISVKDNGIGFDSEHAEKIFEPFSRLYPKDKYEGTGLGLALCKNIAEKHGGSIYADGSADGATIHVLLPKFSENDEQASAG